MGQIRHTALARDDLLSIWVNIALKNRAAADRIYERLEARVLMLALYPEIGPARPDIASDARMLVSAPYLVLYRLVPEGVQVVRVLHGARNITAAMFARGVEP